MLQGDKVFQHQEHLSSCYLNLLGRAEGGLTPKASEPWDETLLGIDPAAMPGSGSRRLMVPFLLESGTKKGTDFSKHLENNNH